MSKPTRKKFNHNLFILLLSFVVIVSSLIISFKFLKPNSVQGQTSFGYALRFYGHGSGDIDRVKIPVQNTKLNIGSGDLTLEWWMKGNISNNRSSSVGCNLESGWITGNTIIDRDVYGSGDAGDYGISLFSGRLAFGLTVGNNGTTLCGNRNVLDGAWHHVAATRQGNTLRIFVDGQIDNSVTGPSGSAIYRNNRSTSWPNDPFLVLGAEKHDAGREYPSFNGFMDNLRISNISRYSTNFPRPQTPLLPDANTIALYNFDEGQGTTITDSSINPIHGLLKPGGSSLPGPVYVVSDIFTPTPTITPISPTTTPTPTLTIPSPTAIPPTINPTPTVPTGSYSSIQFDGVNDFARLVDIPSVSTFTLEAWIRRSNDSNTYETFIADANSNYSQAGYVLFIDGGSNDCDSGDQLAYFQLNDTVQCSGVSITTNRWYHIAVSRTSQGVRKIFIDGQLVSTKNRTPSVANSSGRLTIGRAGDYNGEYFSGYIDEVRLSNTARYSTSFSRPTSEFTSDTSTLGLWKFNETGQTVTDSSDYSRNGTLGTSTSVEVSDPNRSLFTPY